MKNLFVEMILCSFCVATVSRLVQPRGNFQSLSLHANMFLCINLKMHRTKELPERYTIM